MKPVYYFFSLNRSEAEVVNAFFASLFTYKAFVLTDRDKEEKNYQQGIRINLGFT